MLINATLLMQAIHFFIAYAMIHFFLLKPVYAVIAEEDAVQKRHNEAIVLHKKTIAQAEQRQQEELQACCHYFEEHKPVIPTLLDFKQPRLSLTVSMPSAEQVRDVKREVEDFIISKVSHVS